MHFAPSPARLDERRGRRQIIGHEPDSEQLSFIIVHSLDDSTREENFSSTEQNPWWRSWKPVVDFAYLYFATLLSANNFSKLGPRTSVPDEKNLRSPCYVGDQPVGGEKLTIGAYVNISHVCVGVFMYRVQHIHINVCDIFYVKTCVRSMPKIADSE